MKNTRPLKRSWILEVIITNTDDYVKKNVRIAKVSLISFQSMHYRLKVFRHDFLFEMEKPKMRFSLLFCMYPLELYLSRKSGISISILRGKVPTFVPNRFLSYYLLNLNNMVTNTQLTYVSTWRIYVGVGPYKSFFRV